MVHSVKDSAEFNKQLADAGSKLVVVDFYATWCGPCKLIAPVLERLAGEFADIVVLKVDVDENEEIASLYGVQSMPTFLFFKNGKKVDSFSGANSTKLEEYVQKYRA